MADPIITVEQLRIIYNQGKSNEVRSLDGVDVQIFPQEYVIIHGPSGCGKSTLMYSIGGFQMPTYGEVTVEGKKLSQMKPRDIVNLHQVGVGMIFQAFYLIPTLTVIENVCLPKTFMGEDQKKRYEEGMKLLQRFGIAEQAHKFPNQLSGGQKQRVAIARSLVNNPQIILADEPVGNLDSESAKNVLQILKDLNEIDKKTIIMVTHNPEHLYYGDRIIRMKDGKIVGEEVNKEKRPLDFFEKARQREIEGGEDSFGKVKTGEKAEEKKEAPEIPSEFKILMRTFKSLSASQVGVLLVPFKAKQLLSHVISELTEEQLSSAEGFLKELLFNNIKIEELPKKLDMDFEEGGANWNKLRAESFSKRIGTIISEVAIISGDEGNAHLRLYEYIQKMFHINFDQETMLRFQAFVKMRMENKIDSDQLRQRLDAPKLMGGVGLNKVTAEKIIREIELIMLLKYK